MPQAAGMRQRGADPDPDRRPRLLVLNEPTFGFNLVSRRDFYRLLDGLAAEARRRYFSSHALSEVEARTDRILILLEGALVPEGALPELRTVRPCRSRYR